MKRFISLIAIGLIGLFSLGTLSSCNKGNDEKNLPVEEVLPLPEEESGFAPDASGVTEEELRGSKSEARNPEQ